MSRIGKQPISIPSGVSVERNDGSVLVRGPKGEVRVLFPDVLVMSESKEEAGSMVRLTPQRDEDAQVGRIRALWGLSQRLLRNAVTGVTVGFSKRLSIEGVGYRAEMQGKDLVLHLGYSHPVKIAAQEGIQFTVEKNINVTVSGIDKYMVGQVAANIRKQRKPEPYKGKGIRYEGEHVRRKAGKKTA